MPFNFLGERTGTMKNCVVCKTKFKETKSTSIYCSKRCFQKRKTEYSRPICQFGDFKGSRNTKGAIQELKVCADLFLKGYDVFRSVSPSAHCDLIISDGNGLIKTVEVRSAVKNRSGNLSFGRKGEYQVMAAVYKDKILYEGLES